MAITRLGGANAITGTIPTSVGGTGSTATTLPASLINNTSIGNVTALPAAVPIAVDGISSSATSTLLTLSSDNRLGIDQSSDINQIISASGLNGQATEDWLRIGTTWICAGVWSGNYAVKVDFDLNSNTSYVIEINGGGYGSQYHLMTGAYRTGTQFQNNLVNDGGTSLTYSSNGATNTFQTSSQTHGTYMVKLTGNVSGSPLVTLI